MKNPPVANVCTACSWPLTMEAWDRVTPRTLTLTIDTCCINARQQDADLNQLEQWAKEKRIKLRQAEELMKELKGDARVAKAQAIGGLPTNFFILGSSSLDSGDIFKGPDMRDELRAILFPKVHTLTPNQQSDVNHLSQHVQSGGDIFVTLNTNDFIKEGKKETLGKFGIGVFHPAEVVHLIRRLFEKWGGRWASA